MNSIQPFWREEYAARTDMGCAPEITIPVYVGAPASEVWDHADEPQRPRISWPAIIVSYGMCSGIAVLVLWSVWP
jgi:hypothetical protein